ncbi:MAG: holo-[acyl-carrier-protein] synthase [Chloroflexi bacterium RBG_13_56_8]|nr:MAG: holo-[acyl-carrier-protein] synthase [Chloroflexi bacterium RBG_13_56_8]
MLSVGVDIAEIARIARVLERWGERFTRRVYTPAEVAYCRGRIPELAARFAAKEAISKALGTGIVGVYWNEMEVLCDRRGKPGIKLYGNALARAQELGLKEWAVSLSHSADTAIAFVVASGG